MIFFKYLNDRKYIISVFIFFYSAFALTLWLEQASLTMMLYPLLISLTVVALFALLDFIHYYQTINHLNNILQTSISIVDNLPATKNYQEQVYQNIIHHFNQDYKHLIHHQNQQYQQALEYYTLWVHQVKVPISALKLTADGLDGSKQKTIISTQLTHIDRYVDMVLTYLRMESINQDLLLQQIDVYPLLTNSIKKYADIFIHNKIKVQIEPFSLITTSDQKWLSFVFDQVISNALKYTKNGIVSITADGQKLLITDTGIGIAPEDLPRIFERGFTGFNGRFNQKSSGLGLFLVKKILDVLGHTITIESTVGVGTIVTIDLKVIKIDLE